MILFLGLATIALSTPAEAGKWTSFTRVAKKPLKRLQQRIAKAKYNRQVDRDERLSLPEHVRFVKKHTLPARVKPAQIFEVKLTRAKAAVEQTHAYAKAFAKLCWMANSLGAWNQERAGYSITLTQMALTEVEATLHEATAYAQKHHLKPRGQVKTIARKSKQALQMYSAALSDLNSNYTIVRSVGDIEDFSNTRAALTKIAVSSSY